MFPSNDSELSMTMKVLWAAVPLAVVVGPIVWLNIWYMRHRKKLTPEQRRQEIEQDNFDQSVW
jgi:hypothetical protein